MLLLIDAGNTRIKWALCASTPLRPGVPPVWLQMASVSHDEMAQLPEQWKHLQPAHVHISNVAGQMIRDQLTAILFDLNPTLPIHWFASVAQIAGIQNHYRNPAQLGCDRLAAVAGAHHLFPDQALIVATGGTATTVDAVSADGVFHGGMILPGLKLMAQSLARNTAQLPQVAESIAVDQPFADNTDQAIVSGCIHAQVGAITRATQVFSQTQQCAVQCVISGGAAPYLLPHMDIPCIHIDNLVLTGLYVVAQSGTL
ncbi:MAG: type III pantothenate kinase [Burkholderiales bacterium]|nr:type III pantothenate kinase [Burkholderiales bacterium]